MKKLVSLIMTLVLSVGLSGMSLYAYAQRETFSELGQVVHQKFVTNASQEKLLTGLSALSNFFIARPRAYLRQIGAHSNSPDALASEGNFLSVNGRAEPMIIDRFPIQAQIQGVPKPDKTRSSFILEAVDRSRKRLIATVHRINDS